MLARLEFFDKIFFQCVSEGWRREAVQNKIERMIGISQQVHEMNEQIFKFILFLIGGCNQAAHQRSNKTEE